MDSVLRTDKEKEAFKAHCIKFVRKHPLENLTYESHVAMLLGSTRERRGFIYDYRLKSKLLLKMIYIKFFFRKK